MTGDIKLGYSQFEELETFARFGTRLDEHTRNVIRHGQRIRLILKQPENKPAPVADQIVLLLALMAGLFDEIPEERMEDAEKAVRAVAAGLPEPLTARILGSEKLTTEDRAALLTLVAEAVKMPPAETTAETNKTNSHG